MKVLAVGGGSGGHVTPVVAVCREIVRAAPDAEVSFWCDRKFGPSAKKIFQAYDPSIPIDMIYSGKLRRYHGLGKFHMLRPSILFPNIIDLVKVGGGFIQSVFKLIKLRPDVIFMKGGYVCLPVGYAARLLRIPMVIHDSDAHPGLTNRLLAPFAVKIGTGAPLKYYNYPKDRAVYVGIPIAEDFKVYSKEQQKVFKHELGFDRDRPLVVVTGGGLGATRINEAVVRDRTQLLQCTSVFLISGQGSYDDIASKTRPMKGWRLEPFISENMAMVLAAADIVVARAGATTLLELAALNKPTIIIPNGMLTAGHQLKNAKVYQDNFAAIIMKEDELASQGALARKIKDLLSAPKILSELGENFGKFARPDAAKEMAELVLSAAKEARD